MIHPNWQHIRTEDIKPIDLSRVVVVRMVSNPVRYLSRYNAHRVQSKFLEDSGAQVVTVEVAYGKREFEVTERGNPWHVQLRTEHEEVWLKEWAWKVGMERIPIPNWNKVIFLDNDITFTNPTWLSEVAHQLETYRVVQPFYEAYDLGPNSEILQKHRSFASMYHENNFNPPQGPGYSTGYYGVTATKGVFWHPGFAIAFRREVFDHMTLFTGGLLGAGDHHMWLAMVGCADRSVPKGVHPRYREAVMNWQEDADREIKGDIGFCHGGILHRWGGSKLKRYYVPRWDIVIEVQASMDDVRVDHNGLPQIIVKDNRTRRMRDLFRGYLRARDEDSITVDDSERKL